MFEVDKENLSPQSPPLPTLATNSSATKNTVEGGEAAHLIRSECERFCCETLRAVFLGEEDMALRDSLVMDVLDTRKSVDDSENGLSSRSYTSYISQSSSVSGGAYLLDGHLERTSTGFSNSSEDELAIEAIKDGGRVKGWFEMWEYKENCRFRGFIAENETEEALFVFFDEHAFGGGLKPGMMALLELAETSGIDCSNVYICLDKNLGKKDFDSLVKDLRWVGFNLTTLADWTVYSNITSTRWTFLSMEVE